MTRSRLFRDSLLICILLYWSVEINWNWCLSMCEEPHAASADGTVCFPHLWEAAETDHYLGVIITSPWSEKVRQRAQHIQLLLSVLDVLVMTFRAVSYLLLYGRLKRAITSSGLETHLQSMTRPLSAREVDGLCAPSERRCSGSHEYKGIVSRWY